MSDNDQEKTGIGSLAALILALAIMVAGLFWYAGNGDRIPLNSEARFTPSIGADPEPNVVAVYH